MKNILILMLLTVFQVFANDSYSQNTPLTLNLNDATVENVLDAIENQSEFYFLCNKKLVNVERKVSIHLEDQNINDILTKVFEGTTVDYVVIDRQIVLSPGEYLAEVMAKLQPITITGKVTDENEEPLPGVSILLKGLTRGSITNVEGQYTIEVDDPSVVLVFSFVGYITQEVSVGDQTVINIKMEQDIFGLEEVVVIGYGVQKKVNLTGSIATVNADFLADRPITNSSQALQGIQGIYANQIGGQPGADNTTIRIRGIGTLNNNDPLVLVNGIEYSLHDIDPADIESISVLKDAASTAIYGNRAANGVILITTKTGKQGKPTIEYNNYFGWQQVTYLPDVVTNSVDYMTARNQAAINEGQPLVYSDAEVEEFRTGTDPDLYPNTDWKELLFQVAPMQEHKLRLSGGNDIVTYSILAGYLNQDGVMKYTGAEKYYLSFKSDLKVSERLKAGIYATSTYWYRYEPPIAVSRQSGNGFARSLPIHPAVLSDGRYGDTWLVTPGHNVFRNPIGTGENGYLKNKTLRLLLNLNAEYTFPFDIKYKINVALNKYDALQTRFIPEIFIFNPKQPDVPKKLRFDPSQRSARSVDNNNLNTTLFQTLNWTRNIGERNNVSLLLGFSVETFSDTHFDAYIEGFLGNELPELNAGTINKDVGGTSSESRLMSYFGRANYSFDNKYLLEFNFRYDGSSRFAKENRWGFFPSFSAGWRIHQETFMQNIESISNLKLRVSWGKLGNQNVPLYSYLNKVNFGYGYSFGTNVEAGAAVANLSDPNISWETTAISDIGLDLGLWNNKLAVTVDVFDKKTTDILARINVPAQVGNLGGPITNLYSMSNKGVEIGLNHSNSIGDLNYNLGTDVTYIVNNVDDLNADIQYTTNRWGALTIITEGSPVNSYFMYEAEGIFQTQEEVDNHAFQSGTTSPGDLKYRDLNGDDVIDENDRKIMRTSFPKYTYSFNLGLGYKGFDFVAFFQGIQGIDIYPHHNLFLPLYNGAGLTKNHLNNSWTPENTDATLPRLTLAARGTKENYRNSTFWLADASYLRLKNIQIGYSITSKVLTRINVAKLRVFANGQNLLTFSDFKEADPERTVLNGRLFEYPSVKIFSFGFNVNF